MAEPGNVMIHSESIIFGEVLDDNFQDGCIIPGWALFNVARHLRAFCQSPSFISMVGNNPLGREIRDAMKLALERAQRLTSSFVYLLGAKTEHSIIRLSNNGDCQTYEQSS